MHEDRAQPHEEHEEGDGDEDNPNRPPLHGRVALVAGATRGAGRALAVELGRAGATVYALGRTTRDEPSEVGRSTETIEGTAQLVEEAGGTGVACRVDLLDEAEVRAVVARIDAAHGRLDVVVANAWGGDHLTEWQSRMWEHDLAGGLRMLRLGVETHLVTAACTLPLLVRRPGGLYVEITDGTAEYNGRSYRRPFYYDLAKAAPLRIARDLAAELPEFGATAVCVTPGWLRSETMLDTHYQVTEEHWRDGLEQNPHFGISETPTFVGRGVTALATDPDRARWNGASLSSGGLAAEYGCTDVDGSAPDAWRYLTEVQDPGLPADTTGYR